MKKKDLIKKIAFEFNVDEVEVSEYFDNIFEALAVTFTKNKNVNIGEFGKFIVRAKPDEEGEKQKTVLFSPVKKFANEINYNFNQLSPVQIRVLDEKNISGHTIEEEYSDEEIEEIIFIDFEEEKIPGNIEVIQEEVVEEEVLIPEETAQEVLEEEIPSEEEPEKEEQEEVLIPEETAQEILEKEIPSEEEPEKEEQEEVLIPEETAQEILEEEIPSEEEPEKEEQEEVLIPEETKQEISDEKIPEEETVPVISYGTEEIIEHIEPDLEFLEVIEKRNRIIDELDKIVLFEIDYKDFLEKIEYAETFYRDKRVIFEATTVIKEEKILESEEISTEEEIKEPEEITTEEEIKESEEILTEEEIKEPDEISTEEEIKEPEEILTEEEIKESEEIPAEEEITGETIPILKTDDEEKEQETAKTSLELEAELLKMLDERKKILEEIKKLEGTDSDELMDISGINKGFSDEKPKLFDENTLDQPKQNIFIDEEGKILEDLLNKIVSFEDSSKETKKEDEIIREEEDKEINSEKEIKNQENLLGTFYEDKTEEISSPDIEEVEPQLNNLEMKVFDKLIDEPGKQQEEIISLPPESSDKDKEGQDLMPLDELESMFKNFKTEISATPQGVKEEKKESPKKEEIKEIKEIKKVEAIKTYDDIFNLLEPNGKKKEVKPVVEVKEEPKKRIPPIARIFILIGIVFAIIMIGIYLYKKSVYKPSDETMQTQVSLPLDSIKIQGNDSVIYADTNKVKETIEEDIVYDEKGIVIKESEKGFFLYFGNFENQFELAKKIKELKDKNIFPHYEEVTVEGKQVYKIKLGPYKSLDKAKEIISKL